jgi:hypothetical protein
MRRLRRMRRMGRTSRFLFVLFFSPLSIFPLSGLLHLCPFYYLSPLHAHFHHHIIIPLLLSLLLPFPLLLDCHTHTLADSPRSQVVSLTFLHSLDTVTHYISTLQPRGSIFR